MEKNESILTKTYDFLKDLILEINKFPRNQRFILGAEMEKMALNVFGLLVEAYYIPPSAKKPKLHRANIELEKMRHLLRLCFELKHYNANTYGRLSGQVDEIGRMCGGWLKTLP